MKHVMFSTRDGLLEIPLRSACQLGITDWILEKIDDPTLGKSKEMLLIAIAKLIDHKDAARVLVKYFDEYPAQSERLLARLEEEVN